ncbi:hypothetical protein [Pseudovibrio sp. SPO723]|uniref:hypothetical protein n=1 Tax=Nesiotobacter zosterae TaxID=392721 RepID=UPI0029C482B6|nr:hypothetical protein [Pseudovibrio sp. SPO723]MDX5594136.1 hypothetical protein [Pseudovibrio sp. SPO723]
MHSGLKACIGAALVFGAALSHLDKANAADPSAEALLYRPSTVLSGWKQQLDGLRHYSGLECPDTVGGLHRSGVTPDIADTGPGCKYLGEQGVEAVFRQHRPYRLVDIQRTFLDEYEGSGFTLVDGPENSLTFQTDLEGAEATMESLWAFQGEESGYTLWFAADRNFLAEADRTLRAFQRLAHNIEQKRASSAAAR